MNRERKKEAMATARRDTVVVLGSGGREHALAMKIAESPLVSRVIVAPGNVGILFANRGQAIECLDIKLSAPFKKLIVFCKENKVSLVVVGPEKLLAEGVCDALRKEGIAVFGPDRQAVQLESSKNFAKGVLTSAGVATPASEKFTRDDFQVLRTRLLVREQKKYPVVVKADGLCAGKGVVIANTPNEAIEAAEEMLLRERFSVSGHTVLIEDFITGQELSVLGVCHGEEVVLLPESQDNKKLYDGDKGPNTGGMGVMSPLPFIDRLRLQKIKKEIFLPVLAEMKKRGIFFQGMLYAGLMIENVDFQESDINVLEFNTRFGDPECQCVLARLDGDLYRLLKEASKPQDEKVDLQGNEPTVSDKHAVTVVLASEGYPGSPCVGRRITDALVDMSDKTYRQKIGMQKGINSDEGNTVVHYSGVVRSGEEIVTSGGRVLAITGVEKTKESARKAVYSRAEKIEFKGKFLRLDIGLPKKT